MHILTKSLLALAGLGLLANAVLSPATNSPSSSAPVAAKSSGTPVGYEENLAKRAEQARLQMIQSEAARPALDFSKYERCVAANDCALHVLGVASTNPILQLVVMPFEADKWTEADWTLAIEFAKERGRWAKANPYGALQQYDGMPESAPFFPTAVANIGQRLNSVSVGVATGRKSKEPRKGVPGWVANNDPTRTNLPF